jgi:hypothetical protein
MSDPTEVLNKDYHFALMTDIPEGGHSAEEISQMKTDAETISNEIIEQQGEIKRAVFEHIENPYNPEATIMFSIKNISARTANLIKAAFKEKDYTKDITYRSYWYNQQRNSEPI